MNIDGDHISFVVPVYNPGLEFFKRCLESLANQTCDRYDVILVNDGSTNGAEKLCTEYAEANDQFSVIDSQNKGPSSARNLGMKAVRDSKWIVFVDSDDRIREDFVAFAIEYLRDKNPDMVFLGSVKQDGETETVHSPLSFEESESLDERQKREILLDLIAEGYRKKNVPESFLNVWGKIYRLGFLKENNILFDEKMTVAEDVVFNIECMLKEQGGVAFVKEHLYIRQVDPTSTGHRYHPEIRNNDREFLKNLKELLSDIHDNEIGKAMKKRYVLCLMGIAKFDMCHKDNPKPFAERSKDLAELAGTKPYKVGIRKCDLHDFSRKNQLKIMLLRYHTVWLFVLLQDVKRI